MIISQIAAMAKNRVIGSDQGLPWDIPEDMKFFKDTTKGHIIIVGRKTYESFGRPLPSRYHIIITRNPDYTVDFADAKVVNNIEDAIDFAKTLTSKWGDEVFVCGGGEIYKQALPLTDRIYLTEISQDFSGDTKFPEFDLNIWQLVKQQAGKGNIEYSFNTYERSINSNL